MDTRILSTSIVRGLVALSLVAIAACDGGPASSPLQPTAVRPSDARPATDSANVPPAASAATLAVGDPRLPQQLSKADYAFEILTCNVADAGTDANIDISVTGNFGSTGWMRLDVPNHNDFERGYVDRFSGTTQMTHVFNVGDPSSFTIKNDGYGNKPGWALCMLKLTMTRTDGTITTRIFGGIYSSGPYWFDDPNGWMRTFFF